jgi:hypothetical protein
MDFGGFRARGLIAMGLNVEGFMRSRQSKL